MNEAWVGPGSRLRRVIVAPGAEVPAGLLIEDAIICPDPDADEALPPATERRDGLRIRYFASKA
jgi:hypothetical protein